ncbi:TRAP transporter small permease [uncultured Sneathiella sp.]|jgi:TRAP-type C4-dicarboxylate transport system permease small subunit|uniref:TRAP transporter small permease n=1 Tax=uncultured Sneathiella sp. TaxID=879315 RepID=UPI0030DA551E|tara:strand:- start:10578 stop:11123 length:546 start_codon:yes stop_codon:yes gene_type:complete
MGRFIELAHGFLRRVEILFALAGGAVVLGIMALGCAEIVGRTAFRSPIHGSLDMVEQLMVVVAAFGIAYCQANWGNVRMTLVVSRLKGRARWAFEAFSLLIASFVVAVLVKGSWGNFMRGWEIGGNTPNIYIPLWIGMLAVCVALCLLLLRLLLQFVEALRLVTNPDARSFTTQQIELAQE